MRTSEGDEHLVKVLATPFCSVLTGMPIEYGEEALTINIWERCD